MYLGINVITDERILGNTERMVVEGKKHFLLSFINLGNYSKRLIKEMNAKPMYT